MLPVGPVLPSGDETSIFKEDGARYMEWLDAKPASSVVYVSFGSLATMAREQLDELLILGLEEGGRPYLLVVRKDDKATLTEAEAEMGALRLESGVVVEWCDRVRVRVPVGCFLTHWWNSVMESVASSVPMIGVPKVSECGGAEEVCRGGDGDRAAMAEVPYS